VKDNSLSTHHSAAVPGFP